MLCTADGRFVSAFPFAAGRGKPSKPSVLEKGMIVFYNKPLLRILVIIAGVSLAFVGYNYAQGMFEVLGRQGMIDALAILGYVAASYLVLIVAEVADSHYVRAFGGLSLGAGLLVAWRFLGYDLAKLEPGISTAIYVVFLLASAIGAAYLAIVVVRLVLDRLNLGRPAIAEAGRIGTYEGGVEPPPYRSRTDEPKMDRAVWNDPSMMPGALYDSGDSAAKISGGAALPSAEHEEKPASRLVGISGAFSGEIFELSPGEFVIGRADDADFPLAGDNQVSRKHASIKVNDDGFAEIEDLGSTNGIFVNGARTTSSKLLPGMTLSIGTSIFKVE